MIPALRDKGVDELTVVNPPIERARLYFRFRPMPNLLVAADPERTSHRAFGLPNLEFTESESEWPRKASMGQIMSMRINITGELPEPLDPFAAAEALNTMDGYVITDSDQRMMAAGAGQLVGEFLLDREGSFAGPPPGCWSAARISLVARPPKIWFRRPRSLPLSFLRELRLVAPRGCARRCAQPDGPQRDAGETRRQREGRDESGAAARAEPHGLGEPRSRRVDCRHRRRTPDEPHVP